MPDIVRDVIGKVAREELPVVDGLAALDPATARRRLAGHGGRREPLGFGLGEIVALVTPVVWIVVDQVANRVAESAVDGATRGSRSVLRRVFGRKRADRPAVVGALTTEQLAEVRRLVLENAERRGLDAERAEAVADAVVARLAMHNRDEDSPPKGE